MWQSMKIPGTPLATHCSTGAPMRGSLGDPPTNRSRRGRTHCDVRHEMAARPMVSVITMLCVWYSPIHYVYNHRKGQRSHSDGERYRKEQTHVKPICTILDHPLTFSGELAKVRGEYRGGDNCSRHILSILTVKNGTEIFECHHGHRRKPSRCT